MTQPILPLAEAIASLRTALDADAQAASARRESALRVLLTLLLRLLTGLDRLPQEAPAAQPEPVYRGDRPLHVLCIEAGLLPSWLLRAYPATGMRPSRAPVPRPRRARHRPPPRAPSTTLPHAA